MHNITIIVGSPKESIDGFRYVSTEYDKKIIEECLHFFLMKPVKRIYFLHSEDVIFNEELYSTLTLDKFSYKTDDDLHKLLNVFVPKCDLVINLSSSIEYTFKYTPNTGTDFVIPEPISRFKLIFDEENIDMTYSPNIIKYIDSGVTYIRYMMGYSDNEQELLHIAKATLSASKADRLVISNRGETNKPSKFYSLRPDGTFITSTSPLKIIEKTIKNLKL